jgi:hypothetical protein
LTTTSLTLRDSGSALVRFLSFSQKLAVSIGRFYEEYWARSLLIGRARSLNLAQVSFEQLQALANACTPATFGRGSDDIGDESYLKDSKTDTSQNATRIVPERTTFIDTVCAHLFEGEDSDRPVICELYKLNVYGAFRLH